VCVSVCGPAPLLGRRPIRVRVESIYCIPSLCNTTVHSSTWYQRIRFRIFPPLLPLQPPATPFHPAAAGDSLPPSRRLPSLPPEAQPSLPGAATPQPSALFHGRRGLPLSPTPSVLDPAADSSSTQVPSSWSPPGLPPWTPSAPSL
jgi:hypothetical protein